MASRRKRAVTADLPNTHTIDFRSEANGEAYRLLLSWPIASAPDTGWPPLIVFDGDAYFGLITDATRNLGTIGAEIEACAVLAIGYASSEPTAWHHKRAQDLTPCSPVGGDVSGPIGEGVRYGGLEPFLDMAEHEALPRLAGFQPIDLTRSVIFGHSFGGLAALTARYTRPGLASRHIAISPSLYWGDQYLRNVERDGLTGALAVAVGGLEESVTERSGDNRATFEIRRRQLAHARMITEAQQFAERAATRGEPVVFRCIDDESHISVPYAALPAALRHVLPIGRPSDAL